MGIERSLLQRQTPFTAARTPRTNAQGACAGFELGARNSVGSRTRDERVGRPCSGACLGEESIPEAGDLSQQANRDRVVAYAPSPQDDAIYRSSREGLQI